MSDPSPAPNEGSLATSPRRAAIELALLSGLALFLELACIRWFGSTVVFLTYFTNIALLASFLGLSLGLLSSDRPAHLIQRVLPTTLAAMVLALLVLYLHETRGSILVDVGGAKSPQQVYFGTEYISRDTSKFLIPIEVLAGLFFALIALMFVGIGQEMGRRFQSIPNRLAAYSFDIAGSVAGIALFGLLSWWMATPHVWFLLVVGLGLALVRNWTPLQVGSALGVLFLAGYSALGGGLSGETIWSPYYKIHYVPQQRLIQTNNIGHQTMVDTTTSGPAYRMPYAIWNSTHDAPPKKVLIIGAGSGNDVAVALAEGVGHVDAVDIDPAIQSIGRRDHPNNPYSNPRVTVHFDDGRNFLRRTDRKYDLIIYALVDSLVLHSGSSSLRLESYLFTREAFHDIAARLEPGGVFVTSNYFRQGWIVARIAEMLRQSLQSRVLVFNLPELAYIDPDTPMSNRITVLIGSKEPTPRFVTLGEADQKSGKLWIGRTTDSRTVAAFGEGPPVKAHPGMSFEPITPTDVDYSPPLLPSDDWPYLYIRRPSIPGLNQRAIFMVAIVSAALIAWTLRGRFTRPDGQMFFLGAGFMLLETRGVIHLALLFGSTWFVNTIVFGSILLLILLSNLIVMRWRPRSSGWAYGLLFAALVLNIQLPIGQFLGLPTAVRALVSGGVAFLPILFAGIVFAIAFGATTSPDRALGSNLAGVVLGGLCEYFSLVLGFTGLLWVAVAFYALAAVSGWVEARLFGKHQEAADSREPAASAASLTTRTVT